jgi:hypothetical protein
MFHGAILVTKGEDGNSVEILMPRAEGDGVPTKHSDKSTANQHFARFANFLKDEVKEQKHLSGMDLEIVAGQGAPTLELQSLFHLDSLVGDPVLRKFGTLHYATRVVLRGGKLSTVDDTTVGTWKLAPSEAEEPLVFIPATGVKWDTQKTEAVLKAEGKTVTLTLEDHRELEIGHQPREPKEWKTKHPHKVKAGTVDDDFKWLYQILVPRGHENDRHPWIHLYENALPAPTCVIPPETPKDDDDDYHKTTVGTPTCFGGCFNCQ